MNHLDVRFDSIDGAETAEAQRANLRFVLCLLDLMCLSDMPGKLPLGRVLITTTWKSARKHRLHRTGFVDE